MVCISERLFNHLSSQFLFFPHLFFIKQVPCFLSTSNNYKDDYGNDSSGGVNAVYYSWIDEFGELLTGSSGNVYTKEETDIFLKRKILTIKVKRKMSVITSVPSEDNNDIQFSISHKLKHHVSYQKRILCDYCGSPITKRDERCPNCQSKINLYK